MLFLQCGSFEYAQDVTYRSESIIGKVVDKSVVLDKLDRFCISIESVKSCTVLIMKIKLNKVALKPEKSRCYPVQSANECLPQES